MMLAEEKRMTC